MSTKKWAKSLQERMRSKLAKLKRKEHRASEGAQGQSIDTSDSRLIIPSSNLNEEIELASRNVDPPIAVVSGSRVPGTLVGGNPEVLPDVRLDANSTGLEACNDQMGPSLVDLRRQTLWDKVWKQWAVKINADSDLLIKLKVDGDDPVAGFQELLDKVNETDSGISPETENVVKDIVAFKDILVATANFDPSKATLLVFRVTFHVLQTLIDDATYSRAVVDSVTLIAATIQQWTEIEFNYSLDPQDSTRNAYQNIEKPLLELYTSVLNILGVLYQECHCNRLTKYLATPGNQTRVSELVKRMEFKASLCKQVFESCKSSIELNKKIREWISPHDTLAVHQSTCDKVALKGYPGCAQWLLKSKEYGQWMAGQSPILWVSGSVGTGKTTVMARIIESHLVTTSVDPKARLAFFYCSKQDGAGRSSCMDVLRSILRQASHDRIADKFDPIIHDAYHRDDSSPEAQGNCEMLLARVLRTGVRVKIIVDALDECDEPAKLLSALQKLYQEAPDTVQLLVTGRQDVGVRPYFEQVVGFPVRAYRTRDDMQTFVKTWVSLLPESQKMLGGNPDYSHLESQLLKLILSKANGMFRWAELQLSYFYKRKKPYKFSSQVSDHLDALNKNSLEGAKALEDIYKKIYEDNISNNGIEERLTVFAYRILIAAKEEFHMGRMTDALSWYKSTMSNDNEPVTADHVLILTQNFVTMSNERESYRSPPETWLTFSHVSALEYLQSQQKLYTKAMCQAALSKACMKYLDAQEPNLFKTQLFERSPINGFYRTMFFTRSSWATYAFRYWGAQCASINRDEREEHQVTELLLDLANDNKDTSNFFSLLAATMHERGWMGSEIIGYNSMAFDKDCVAAEYNLVELLAMLYASERRDSYLKAPRLSHCALIAAKNDQLDALQLIMTKWNEIYPLNRDYESVQSCMTPVWISIHLRNDKAVKFALVNKFTMEKDALVTRTARIRGATTIMKLLLEHGANPNVADAAGKTALHYAQENKAQDMIDLLFEHGAKDGPILENRQYRDIRKQMIEALRGPVDAAKFM